MGLVALAVVVGFIALSGGDDTDKVASNVPTTQPTTQPTFFSPSAPTTPIPDVSPTAPESPAASRRSLPPAIPRNERAEIGDYIVTVNYVNLDATDEVEEKNSANDPPKIGKYVLVTVSVTLDPNHNGAGEANPGEDLEALLIGDDGVEYSDSDANCVGDPPSSTTPDLDPGGTTTYEYCLDVPVDIRDPQLLVGHIGFDSGYVHWETD